MKLTWKQYSKYICTPEWLAELLDCIESGLITDQVGKQMLKEHERENKEKLNNVLKKVGELLHG